MESTTGASFGSDMEVTGNDAGKDAQNLDRFRTASHSSRGLTGRGDPGLGLVGTGGRQESGQWQKSQRGASQVHTQPRHPQRAGVAHRETTRMWSRTSRRLSRPWSSGPGRGGSVDGEWI